MNTNGSISTDAGSVQSVASTVSTVDKPPRLTIDDKLDKIMEAVVFQQQLLLSALKAMDRLLAKNESKIIKPVL